MVTREGARTLLAAIAALCMLGIAGPASGAAFLTSPTRNIVCGALSGDESEDGWPVIYCATRNDGLAMMLRGNGVRMKTRWRTSAYGRVLPYGRSRAIGPFRCFSETEGMTCVLRRTGRGFFISRDSWDWVP